MKRTDRFRYQRGTQLVELGLVLPILVMLALGIIDMAGLIHANQVVSNAAREGARLSIMPENDGNGTSAIVTRVQTYIINENDIACTATPAVTINQNTYIPTASGVSMKTSDVTVVCPYAMRYLPSLTANVIPATVNIQGRVKFRNFY